MATIMKRDPRTERLDIRLTRNDKRAIEGAAAKAGMTTSEYVRACTLGSTAISPDLRVVMARLATAGREEKRRLAQLASIIAAQPQRRR